MSKTKLTLIGACIFSVIMGTVLFFSPKLIETDHPSIGIAKSDKPNNHSTPIKTTTGPSKIKLNPDQISKSRESDVFNPELMYLSDYKGRVQKHLRIKLYHESPASETVECAQILEILNAYQLGVEAVFDAYSLTWQYHYETKPRIKGIPDGEFKDTILFQTHGRLVQRFLERYEIEETQIIEELLQIKPTVFFGNIITDVSIQPGERLLVE